MVGVRRHAYPVPQSKTRRRIVPADAPLRALLDLTERRGPVILTNTTPMDRRRVQVVVGQAFGFTISHFMTSGVRPRDILRSPVPQIATFTGHSLKDVEAILDAHYLWSRHPTRRDSSAKARSANKTARSPVKRLAFCAMPILLVLEKLGGRTRARTWDPMIKSLMLT